MASKLGSLLINTPQQCQQGNIKQVKSNNTSLNNNNNCINSEQQQDSTNIIGPLSSCKKKSPIETNLSNREAIKVDQLNPLNIFKKNIKAIQGYKYNKKVGSYLIGDCLGKGSFAKVNEALHTITGEKVAIKVIDKSRCSVDAYVRRTLRREGRLLQQLKHPNLVQLLEILETEHAYYLALELCPGEGLLGKIGTEGKLSENTARRYLKQLMSGVTYMHNQGVIHRDLKVENILLSENDQIKIIDFGLSTQIREPGHYNRTSVEKGEVDGCYGVCKTQCGSPAYAAPEVLSKKPYGMQADVWSIGVNLFAMIAGLLPFSVRPFSISALCQKMLHRDMNPLPPGISQNCTDLINRLLDPNPQTRIRLHEARQHVWLMSPKKLNKSIDDYQQQQFNKPQIKVQNFTAGNIEATKFEYSNNAEKLFYPEYQSVNLSDNSSSDSEQTNKYMKIHSPIMVTTISRWILESFPHLTMLISKSNASVTLPQRGDTKDKENLAEFVRHVMSNTPGPYVTIYHLLIAKAHRYCRKYRMTFQEWLLKVFDLNHQSMHLRSKQNSNYLNSQLCLPSYDGSNTMINYHYGSRDRIGFQDKTDSSISYTSKKFLFDKNFNNLESKDRHEYAPSITELSNLTTDSSVMANSLLNQKTDLLASSKTLASTLSKSRQRNSELSNRNMNMSSNNFLQNQSHSNTENIDKKLRETKNNTKNYTINFNSYLNSRNPNLRIFQNYDSGRNLRNSSPIKFNKGSHQFSTNNLLNSKYFDSQKLPVGRKLESKIGTLSKKEPGYTENPQKISKSSNCVTVQPFYGSSNTIKNNSRVNIQLSNNSLITNQNQSMSNQFKTMPSNRTRNFRDEINSDRPSLNQTSKLKCIDFERILRGSKTEKFKINNNSIYKRNDSSEKLSLKDDNFIDVSHINTVSGANGLLNKWRNFEKNNLKRNYQNQSRSNIMTEKKQEPHTMNDESMNNMSKHHSGKEFFPYFFKHDEVKDRSRQNFQLFIDSSTLSSLSNKSDASLSRLPSSKNDLSAEGKKSNQPSSRVQIIKAIS